MLTNADPNVRIQVKEMLLWQHRKRGKRLLKEGRNGAPQCRKVVTEHIIIIMKTASFVATKTSRNHLKSSLKVQWFSTYKCWNAVSYWLGINMQCERDDKFCRTVHMVLSLCAKCSITSSFKET